MENAELLFHQITDFGFTHQLCLRTKRGIHVGQCAERYGPQVDRRPEGYARAVDIWHPVPRWMHPQEVLNLIP